jgi:hypothetical protein
VAYKIQLILKGIAAIGLRLCFVSNSLDPCSNIHLERLGQMILPSPELAVRLVPEHASADVLHVTGLSGAGTGGLSPTLSSLRTCRFAEGWASERPQDEGQKEPSACSPAVRLLAPELRRRRGRRLHRRDRRRARREAFGSAAADWLTGSGLVSSLSFRLGHPWASPCPVLHRPDGHMILHSSRRGQQSPDNCPVQ